MVNSPTCMNDDFPQPGRPTKRMDLFAESKISSKEK